MRRVICHYHIYKNAGTSFEAVLDQSFGAAHLRFDGPFPFFTIDQEQLDRIILRKTGAIAFSSHQIQLPAPVSRAYQVVPVVFLRHPVLRIASVWRFKRAAADGTETSRLAQSRGFADWIETCLADPQEITQVSNAQTRLLSARFRERPRLRRTAGAVEYDLEVARANLADVECLGRTETFDDDVRAFARRLAPQGLRLSLPDDLHRNATWRPVRGGAAPPRAGDGVAGLVEAVLDGLAPALRRRLTDANAQDAELYALACRRGSPPQQPGMAAAEGSEAR